MAKDDESQQNSGAKGRVYKSKDVHRRRADRKALKDRSASSSLSQSGESPQSDESVQSGQSGMNVTVTSPNEEASNSGVLTALSPAEKRKLRQASALADNGVVQKDAEGTRKIAVFPVDKREHRQSSVPVDDDAAVSVDVASETASGSEVDSDQGNAADAEAAADSVDVAGDDANLSPDDANQASDVEEPEADADADADADAEEGEDSTADQDEQASPKRPKASLAKRAIGTTVLVIVLLVVGIGAYFAWDRWGRYDDHADMQGEWYVAGTTVPLTIDATQIHLTDDLSYEYEIDDHGKTIHFTFGPMEGQGRYWFSGDRRFLAITDGEGYNGAGTAFEDVMHGFKDLSGDAITGTHLPEGEGVIVFCREPGMLATMAKEAAERGKERAKKQAEREKAEAERKAAAQEEIEARAAEAGAIAAGVGGSVDYGYYDDGSADVVYEEEYVDGSSDEGSDVVYEEAPEEAPDETYVEYPEDGGYSEDGSAEEYE